MHFSTNPEEVIAIYIFMIATNTSNASKMPKQTNVFLIINLGCEMLYVIDQRLKAQCITLDKSAQGKYICLTGKPTNYYYAIC